MNRTKIEWCDFSWNPIVGCAHGCWYCYARKLAQRFPKNFPNGFEPTFYPERLKEPWNYKKPSKIFVYSVADLFAPWSDPGWRWRVIGSAAQCPVKHTFMFLTKNPENIDTTIKFPENFWMGTTVTNEFQGESCLNIESIKRVQCGVRFVSFEPLLAPLPFNVNLEGIDWVIIGKLTGSRRIKFDPGACWDIINRCVIQDIPVFIKNNILDLKQKFIGYADFPRWQDFPKPKLEASQ